MRIVVVLLALFICVGLVAPAVAFHNDAVYPAHETRCEQPDVIFCDNFEDRDAGFADFGKHTYKNAGWNGGDPCLTVDTSNPHDGTKAFRINLLAVVALQDSQNACRFGDSGGAGHIGATWVDPVRTIYARWYTKWSANYVWSMIGEKHSIFQPVNTDGRMHIFGSLRGGFGPTFGLEARGSTIVIGGGNQLFQNVNGKQPWVLNTWFCVEVRLTSNEPAAAFNATIEGWINDVKHWNYPNIRLQSTSAIARFRDIILSGYWNCYGSRGGTTGCHSDARNAHPDMQRYYDRVIVATSRIGCSGTAPPPG